MNTASSLTRIGAALSAAKKGETVQVGIKSGDSPITLEFHAGVDIAIGADVSVGEDGFAYPTTIAEAVEGLALNNADIGAAIKIAFDGWIYESRATERILANQRVRFAADKAWPIENPGVEIERNPIRAWKTYPDAVPIGTVTKVTSRPCNCPGKGVEGGWHATWCAAKQVEIAIGAAPTAQVINDLERARRAFGDCAMVRDLEAKAHRCTCGTKDGKHANTCGVLGEAVSPKVERARPVAELFDSIPVAPGAWNVYGELMKQQERFIASHMLDCAQQGTAPTLGWLARELRLAPNAPDETIKATVRKRLAGQYDDLIESQDRNHEFHMRAEAAQEKLEQALCEIAEERRENDTLRGMVAEVQLENRKLQRKGGA